LHFHFISTTSKYATAYVTPITRCEVDQEGLRCCFSDCNAVDVSGMKCMRTGRWVLARSTRQTTASTSVSVRTQRRHSKSNKSLLLNCTSHVSATSAPLSLCLSVYDCLW